MTEEEKKAIEKRGAYEINQVIEEYDLAWNPGLFEALIRAYQLGMIHAIEEARKIYKPDQATI